MALIHKWVKSTLGHGSMMCVNCFTTDAEAAALGQTERCDAAPWEEPTTVIRLRRRREAVSAFEVLDWLQKRPGASWIATVNDINQALDDICK